MSPKEPASCDARTPLERVVSETERLLWGGRPRQGILLRRADVFLIPFSLLWCGFAVSWEVTAATRGAPTPFLLFGGLFVLVGLYFVFGRFLVDAVRRKRTRYGITSERVLIQSGNLLESLDLCTLSGIALATRQGDEGTITFGPRGPWDAWLDGLAWPGVPRPAPRFARIPDAKAVYEILRCAQREGSERRL